MKGDMLSYNVEQRRIGDTPDTEHVAIRRTYALTYCTTRYTGFCGYDGMISSPIPINHHLVSSMNDIFVNFLSII